MSWSAVKHPWYKRLIVVRWFFRPKKIAEFKSIQIPMIRNMNPTLSAEDLIGVEPMTESTGLAYSFKFSKPPSRFKKFLNTFRHWIYRRK